MSEQDCQPKHLPPGLTATVGVVQDILGEVVTEAEGKELFDIVEGVRLEMVAFREAESEPDREAALNRASERLAGLTVERKTAFARAYTLYLELVNVCENAYRTHRLAEKREPARTARAQLTFVLTAHPTESRSPANIRILRRVQDHVTAALSEGRPIDRREVTNLVHLAWRAGTHPATRPSVDDEANHIFSMLTDPILSEVTALTDGGHRVLFRSWVGGDKDGHPGVGPQQTVAALQRARGRLLAFVDAVLLRPAREDVALAGDTDLDSALSRLEGTLAALSTVSDGDGGRVEALYRAIYDFQAGYGNELGIDHPAVARLTTLLEMFPALVVPLELREERGRFSPDEPIADMMRRIAALAAGGRVDAYARAVVVSMTLEAEDLVEAQRLVIDVFGEPALPVIPLFELPDVLERAPTILRDVWTHDAFRRAVRERGHLEVMLGYSDTAKRMGMLASRVALHDAMRAIGEWAEVENLTLLFFHGHGGSVGRGGGRIEDLVATWPPRARTPYKHTVQGEMVERTLATPEILRSLVEKVADVQQNPPAYCGVGELARELADRSKAAFETRVRADSFRRLLERATPYARLSTLTIGSRPASRGDGGLEELRAIPWVLCWTQTRLLLHAWLGAGQAWRELRQDPAIDERLAAARDDDPLFRSYARLLSFTMAKTEPGLWRRYWRALAPDLPDELMSALEADYEAALDLACRARGAGTLLPERPWLDESIRYRAPMIHPLNLLQIELLAQAEWDEAATRLFRETVTGIAAGMLTTG
ncbi:MAG TPA: phosphoenolpyruvate carboxylase [Longimicrobiales bacterium]|nr:phosphoenolpyruvate carboxylase [Longimicrobiales bacterium]